MACALAAGDAVVLGFGLEGVAESKEEDNTTATADGGTGDGTVAGATAAAAAVADGTTANDTVAMEVSVKAEGEEPATEVQVKEEEVMVKEEEEVGEVPEMRVEKAAAMEKVAMEKKEQQEQEEQEEEVVEFVETVYEPIQGPWYLVIKPNNMGNEALAQVVINPSVTLCLSVPFTHVSPFCLQY